MSKKAELNIVVGIYVATLFFSWSYPIYFFYKTDGLLRIVGTMFGVLTIVFLGIGTSNKYLTDLGKEAEKEKQTKLAIERAETEKRVLANVHDVVERLKK